MLSYCVITYLLYIQDRQIDCEERYLFKNSDNAKKTLQLSPKIIEKLQEHEGNVDTIGKTP